MNSQNTAPVYDAKRVAELLGIRYTEVEIAAFGTPPKAQPGYLTFFDSGCSILALRVAMEDKRPRFFYSQSWYDNQDFALKEDPLRYRQLRMNAVKDSFRKTFAQQLKLLAKDEEVPLARIVVMGAVIHFLATGQQLFPNYWVRCLDTISGGGRIDIGDFDADGLDVDRGMDFPFSFVGLAPVRNS